MNYQKLFFNGVSLFNHLGLYAVVHASTIVPAIRCKSATPPNPLKGKPPTHKASAGFSLLSGSPSAIAILLGNVMLQHISPLQGFGNMHRIFIPWLSATAMMVSPLQGLYENYRFYSVACSHGDESAPPSGLMKISLQSIACTASACFFIYKKNWANPLYLYSYKTYT